MFDHQSCHCSEVELDMTKINKTTLKKFLFEATGVQPRVAFKTDADFQTYMNEQEDDYYKKGHLAFRDVKKALYVGLHGDILVLSQQVTSKACV